MTCCTLEESIDVKIPSQLTKAEEDGVILLEKYALNRVTIHVEAVYADVGGGFVGYFNAVRLKRIKWLLETTIYRGG